MLSVAVAAGTDYSLAVRAAGTVWAWGSNSDGQLGDAEVASDVLHNVGNVLTTLTLTMGIAGALILGSVALSQRATR